MEIIEKEKSFRFSKSFFKGHNDTVNSLKLNKMESKLGSCSDNQVRIWDLKSPNTKSIQCIISKEFTSPVIIF